MNEKNKCKLECNLGCYVLENLFDITEYDLLDAYSAIVGFIPANHVICRENYLYK